MDSNETPANMQRRNFLKAGSVVAGAALAPVATVAAAQEPAKGAPDAVSAAPNPNAAAESMPPNDDPVVQSSSGGEFMVDVLKALGFDYIAINPASSFRGIHEAIINYSNNKPEILTCTHEEIAVAMAQGYAKMEGKPMGVMAHGTVGLQHASMGLYNAYVDRAPVYMMVGNILEGEMRGNAAEWVHSAQDPGASVRDYVKWDDQPHSLQGFAESAVRAYRMTMTPPMAPVLLSLDAELQENPIHNREELRIPKNYAVTLPMGDAGALTELAKMLVAAKNPVIVVDRMTRTQAGMDRLVALAEAVQCAVLDLGGRTNFPALHSLNQTVRGRGIVSTADLVVGLELNDYWASVNAFSDRIHRRSRSTLAEGARTVHLGMRDLYAPANFQDIGRYQDIDVTILGDPENSLPFLTSEVLRLTDANAKAAMMARGAKLAKSQAAALTTMRETATIGWDSSPITVARLYAELWEQIKDDDWSLVGEGITNPWGRRLWPGDKRYRYNAGSGGWGIGYNIAGSLGGALANRAHGRLSVAIQGDGDFNFAPGTLWTAAHHRIPILYVMHNNRAYHQEVMYLQAMANRRERGIQNAHVGTTLTNPNIDYASIARGYGVHGEGPVQTPLELRAALKRALAIVRRGEPALIDAVTEAR